MLGCLEVVEYSLTERFNIKYLHQVSLSAFARCNWCVPIILLSTRYNVCTCRIPIYCYLSGTTRIPVIVQCITTSLLLCCLLRTVSQLLCVSWLRDHRACISENSCLKSGLIRNTYTRYHICLMRELIILLQSNISLFASPLLLSTSNDVS